MDLLMAVNSIITKLGENPVDHLDYKHPTVTVALQHLTSATRELQVRGWWFNKHKVKLEPDYEGKIQVPEGTIRWLTKPEKTHLRGTRVVDSKTGSGVWDKPLEGEVTFLYDFVELPESFKHWVVATALIQAYMADYGLEDVVQIYQQEAFKWSQEVQKEHLLNVRLNSQNRYLNHRLHRAIWR